MHRRLAALISGPALLCALMFGAGAAQPPPENAGAAVAAGVFSAPQPGPSLSQAGPIAEPLFAARCATCHEPASGRAPDRQSLRTRAPDAILQAITDGPMRGYAEGLNPQQMRAIAVFLAGKPFGAAPVQLAEAPCAVHPPLRQTPSSWNGWLNGTPGNRYQPNPGFSAAQAPRLKVKWAFAVPSGAYGQPTVVGDYVFLTTITGAVYALDAKSGCVHWRHDAPVGARTTVIVEHRPGASPSGWLAYFGDSRGQGAEGVGAYYALDAMSGELVWKLDIDRHPFLRFTGSPVIYKDRLYVASSSFEEGGGAADGGCCTFTGAMTAVDLKTHKVVWQSRVMDTPKPTRRNDKGGQMYGPAGGAIWMAPVVDPRRNLIYVGTGDSYSEVESGRADAIMAFDADTGAVRWVTQTTAGDNYLTGCPRGVSCPLGQPGPDHDFGASPVIVRNAGGEDVLMIGQKSSFVHALNPDTGALLWQRQLGAGSPLGGVEWGMASDGRYLFVANSDQLSGPRGQPGLTALNPANGETVWHVDTPKVPCHMVTTTACRNAQSAAVSAMPGLVFSGTTDGRIRAYRAADGKIVWEFDTTGQTYDTVNGVKNQPGGNIDTVGPVIAGGVVYVMSGYVGPGVSGGNPVNVLLAFSVDGK